jgi:hypothetical protein
MSQHDLEKRVAVLEAQVQQLMLTKRQNPGPNDWLSTVGMFSGDEYMKQIDAAALEFREQDRRRARKRNATKKKPRRAKS